jgi:hypothetical protein
MNVARCARSAPKTATASAADLPAGVEDTAGGAGLRLRYAVEEQRRCHRHDQGTADADEHHQPGQQADGRRGGHHHAHHGQPGGHGQ